MSYSFQKFLSTLSSGTAGVATPPSEEAPSQDNAMDVSGGFAPLVLFDPHNTEQKAESVVTQANPCDDSPGTNPCDTSSVTSSAAPLVFSKAEEFISAALSNVTIATQDTTTKSITNHQQTVTDSSHVEEQTEETKNLECDDIDSKSALNKTPYVADTNTKDDVTNNRSNSISDSSTSKMWREGMDKASGGSSKTMFISHNLTKKYDKADAVVKGISYDGCVAKVMRECTYFAKILKVIGDDLRNTEYTKDREDVLKQRQKIKDKIEDMKASLNAFVKETLEGEVRDDPPVKSPPVEKVRAEYVHPPEKKTAKEAKAELCLENVDVANSLHKCSDCGNYITIGEGESIESAVEKHCNSAEHKSMVPSEDQGGERKSREKMENGKKSVEKVARQTEPAQYKTQSRQMMLNQITSQTTNGQVMLTCNPCGDVISVEAFTSHVNSNIHRDNLNNFNMRLQKDLIVKYPDLFGPGKMYHLTDMHTVMNKIFVDPLAKYSYCGLCKKELPSKQLNIDEHITSKAHERLLLQSMEGKVTKVQAKDPNQVTIMKSKTVDADVDGGTNHSTDILNSIIKQRSQQDRRSSGNIQAVEIDERDKIYVTSSNDGKFICLLCDARGITSIQCLISHLNGGPHKNNMEHLKQIRGGLDPDAQMLFIKNMVSVTYGRFPLVFECFACSIPPFTGLQGAVDHINSTGHIGMLLQKQQQQKTQYLKPERRESRQSNVVTSVILHRNGINFWCLSCRFELLDITSAYRHVLLPGHLTASVDGVSMLQGTQFYCEYCSVVINGEKNVGQHIVSQKHRQQVLAISKGNNGYDVKASPSFSRAQTKRTEDEKNGNKQSPQQSADETKLKIEERMLLHKNFINILKKNIFQCKLCESEQMSRAKILTHIFSYEHTLKMQLQQAQMLNAQ